MRAMIMYEHGGAEVLLPADCPEPDIAAHEVLVEVHATSVNPVDIKIRSAQSSPRPLPLILGYDVSGVIVRCGTAVSGWHPGDEIFAAANLFKNGANAEYVALDARSIARKPESVSHTTAAALPLVCQTAWESLHLRARIQPGETVLIHAGAGGVGHVAVQMAKLHGCRVLTTAGREESIAFCRDVLQVHEVIDYRKENVVERVKELTSGEGLPVVFNTVGQEVFLQCLDCLAVNGRLVTILGSDTGDRGRGLLYRNLTIHYEFMGVPTAHEIEPERPGSILAGVSNLVDGGLLRPHVSQELPLEEVASGHRQVETGHSVGKVVISVRK